MRSRRFVYIQSLFEPLSKTCGTAGIVWQSFNKVCKTVSRVTINSGQWQCVCVSTMNLIKKTNNVSIKNYVGFIYYDGFPS